MDNFKIGFMQSSIFVMVSFVYFLFRQLIRPRKILPSRTLKNTKTKQLPLLLNSLRPCGGLWWQDAPCTRVRGTSLISTLIIRLSLQWRPCPLREEHVCSNAGKNVHRYVFNTDVVYRGWAVFRYLSLRLLHLILHPRPLHLPL